MRKPLSATDNQFRINLINFNPYDFEHQCISSPRSLKAMSKLKIKQSDLYIYPKAIILTKYLKLRTDNEEEILKKISLFEHKR